MPKIRINAVLPDPDKSGIWDPDHATGLTTEGYDDLTDKLTALGLDMIEFVREDD